VSGAHSAPGRVAALQGALRRRLPAATPVDPLTGGLVRELQVARPQPVAALAEMVGLSERQLHRRCVAAFGYGPKTLDRVLRLQRFLALGRSAQGRPGGLAELAADAGYADQAHLAHDCRALAGATPAALLR
jgi:transcriptional regulator GlxA family with amidase domain